MVHRIEVISNGSMDAVSKGLILKSPIRVYNIDDNTLTTNELKNIEALLADPIVDIAATDKSVLQNMPKEEKTSAPFVFIEKSPKPGVGDPHGKESKKAIEDILGRKIGGVSYGEQYFWKGALSTQAYVLLQKQLGNPTVNEFRRINAKNWNPEKSFGFHFPYVKLPKVPAFSYEMTTDGVIDKKNLITGSGVVLGDVIIGFGVDGLMTNGYSLARYICDEMVKSREVESWDTQMRELNGRSIRYELSRPHRPMTDILFGYDNIEGVLSKFPGSIKGMAHITGGGQPDNIVRMVPDDCMALVNGSVLPTPPLMQLFREKGIKKKSYTIPLTWELVSQ